MVEDAIYKKLIMMSPWGYAYHKIIFDAGGVPVDYEILDVNPAFENLTGLKAGDVINRRITEVIPEIKDSDFDWIGVYADVAANGTEKEFETYSRLHKKWFQIKASSPKKDHFITVFSDISREKIISETSKLFLGQSTEKIDYQKICDNLLTISNAKYASLNLFEPDGRGFTTVAVSGLSANLKKGTEMLGFELKNKVWKHDPGRAKKIEKEILTRFDSLEALTGAALPGPLIKLIENTFQLGETAVLKIKKGDRNIGDFTIMLPRGEKLKNMSLLEIYAQQIGLIIDRNRLENERILAEKEIQNKNEELTAANTELLGEKVFTEALLECLPGYLYVYDREGKLIRWNKKHETMTGYSAEELSRKTLSDWFEGDDAVRVAAAVEEVFAKGYGEVEANLLIKGGGKLLVYSNGVRLNFDGKTYFVGVGMDITRRKLAEEALRNSESRYVKMISNIGDVIVIIDREGINRYKSSNIEKIFGWKPEEVIGASTWDNVHPEDLGAAQKFLGSLMEKPNASGTTECRYRCKDGTWKWIEITVVNLLHDKDICGILGNYKDITPRKLAEEEHAKLQGELLQAQKMESVGRLAGGVAHDFNNMLGVILGHSEMAMERMDSSDVVYDDLKEIYRAAIRSADLTRQLLTYARKQIIVPRILDVNKTIDGLVKMLSRLIGENISLSWIPDKTVCPVKMDSSQMDQMLTNLCLNARDAISGVGCLTITTGNFHLTEAACKNRPEMSPGSYLVLSVGDDGCGMDPETLENLFEPFFTTKDVGRGTGLGLSTIYGIVKQNNGFIEVESAPKKGSLFKIYLPCYTGPAEPGPGSVKKSTPL